jgi:hypothetical protein
LPSDIATVLISIQSHLENGRDLAPEAFTPFSDKEWTYGVSERKIVCSLLTLCEEAASVVFLASDRAQSFNQRLALCAIVDDECVVFAMR